VNTATQRSYGHTAIRFEQVFEPPSVTGDDARPYGGLVAVSGRNRKILWVEAGGRCAICRKPLVTEGTETDDPSVIGEEAHIVARSPGGPRAGDIHPDRLDHHENLILVCREHHKQIDDQPNHHTVERLRQIKQAHKEWTASLGQDEAGPMRVVPDPTVAQPRLLKIISTGHVLWQMVEDSVAIEHSYPDHLAEEDEDFIIEFLDLVKDCGDISGDLTSVRQQHDAGKALGRYVGGLAERGFLVGAYVRRMLLKGGVKREPMPWPILRIEVQPATHAQVVNVDGDSLVDQGGMDETE
jgi:hypothetical protein